MPMAWSSSPTTERRLRPATRHKPISFSRGSAICWPGRNSNKRRVRLRGSDTQRSQYMKNRLSTVSALPQSAVISKLMNITARRSSTFTLRRRYRLSRARIDRHAAGEACNERSFWGSQQSSGPRYLALGSDSRGCNSRRHQVCNPCGRHRPCGRTGTIRGQSPSQNTESTSPASALVHLPLTTPRERGAKELGGYDCARQANIRCWQRRGFDPNRLRSEVRRPHGLSSTRD